MDFTALSDDMFIYKILGCHCGGLVTVPISAGSTSSHLLHVLEKSRLSVLVVDEGLVERALSVLTGAKTNVRHLVVLGNVNASSKEAAEKSDIQVTSINDIEAKGAQDPKEQNQPRKFHNEIKQYKMGGFV